MRTCLLMMVMVGLALIGSTALGDGLSTEQILEAVYGGDFTDYAGQGWPNYQPGSNGLGVTATQLDNTAGAGVTNLLQTTIGGDELWEDGIARFGFMARYAGYWQQYGYLSGYEGFGYDNYTALGMGPTERHQLINTGDFSQAYSFNVNPANWRWARNGFGGLYSSQASDNPDGYDHLITYLITFDEGYEGETDAIWVLCWEDLPDGGDKDYNDLVVEVHAARAVPLPASALAGMGMLGGLSIIRKLRRMR